MEEFLMKMESIDSKQNHTKNLEALLLTYLTSADANCQKERCDMLLLVSNLKELFV